MVGVEQWAEIRRLYVVKRLSIKEVVRRTGHSRNTIRRALRSAEAPIYRRPPRPSKLDPFRDEIHRLCGSIRGCPGRAREERGDGQHIPPAASARARELWLPVWRRSL